MESDVSLSGDVDHVDGIVRGVRDVDASRRLVHGRMIEAAPLRVRGQVDEARGAAAPRQRPPASSATRRSTLATMRSRAAS